MAAIIERKSGKKIEFDALLSIVSDHKSKVTQRPIEDGSDITDHIILQNKQITLEGIISDATLDPSVREARITDLTRKSIIPGFLKNYINGGFVTQFFTDPDPKYKVKLDPERSRYAEAKSALTELYQSRELFTLVEGNTRHENMTLTSFSFPRNASLHRALRFSLSLQEVRVVSNKYKTSKVKRAAAPIKEATDESSTSGKIAPPPDPSPTTGQYDRWFGKVPFPGAVLNAIKTAQEVLQ